MTERKKNPMIKERLGKPKDLNIDDLPGYTNKWFVEPKLDGLRGIIIKDRNKVIAYTSNGIKVPNAVHICQAIGKLSGSWVFDGEFFSKNWNETQSLVMTQSVHPKAENLCIRVFDVMLYIDWLNKKSEPLFRRKGCLDRLCAKMDSKRVHRLMFNLINNTKGTITKEYKRALKKGHEGLMLKDPNAAYPFKRDKCWLRWKPKQTIDAIVIGVKAANEGKTGKYLGLIGSLRCKFFYGPEEKKNIPITFNCSGMTDEKRKWLTQMNKKGKLLGKCIEVEHEGITVNNKVRFPQFQRMRPDKDEAND